MPLISPCVVAHHNYNMRNPRNAASFLWAYRLGYQNLPLTDGLHPLPYQRDLHKFLGIKSLECPGLSCVAKRAPAISAIILGHCRSRCISRISGGWHLPISRLLRLNIQTQKTKHTLPMATQERYLPPSFYKVPLTFAATVGQHHLACISGLCGPATRERTRDGNRISV